MHDEFTVRINASDLAALIEDRAATAHRLEQGEQAWARGEKEWRRAMDTAAADYNDFRRAVQEALGYDQAALLSDDELVERVRDAVLVRNRKAPEWAPPRQMDTAAAAKDRTTPTMLNPLASMRENLAQAFDDLHGAFRSVQQQDDQDSGPPTETLPPVTEPADLDKLMPEVVRDLLLLVPVTVPIEDIATWSYPTREAVADWAGAVHLDASDNDVRIPPRPAILNPYIDPDRLHADG